jgi:hypothetical protein
MFKRKHINDQTVFLTLISIAKNMNPLGKTGNVIRYLKKEEENMILSNKLFEEVKLNTLNYELNTFKHNPLNIEFLSGLIDGDGNISFYFESTKEGIRPRFNFTIVQDSYNRSLLEEVQSFFNVGNINTLNKNCCIYKASSLKDLYNKILPLFFLNNSNNNSILNANKSLPIIKRNKFVYSYLIIKIILSNPKLNKNDLLKIVEYSYYMSELWYNQSLTEYINNLKDKYKIEDIV